MFNHKLLFNNEHIYKCIFVGLSYKYKTFLNPSTPNVNYSGRTAQLTSKVAFYIFIQQI